LDDETLFRFLADEFPGINFPFINCALHCFRDVGVGSPEAKFEGSQFAEGNIGPLKQQ